MFLSACVWGCAGVKHMYECLMFKRLSGWGIATHFSSHGKVNETPLRERKNEEDRERKQEEIKESAKKRGKRRKQEIKWNENWGPILLWCLVSPSRCLWYHVIHQPVVLALWRSNNNREMSAGVSGTKYREVKLNLTFHLALLKGVRARL